VLLHRKYGKWPIEEFAALSAERKTEFYAALKSQKSKEFTSTLTKTLMVQRLEETGHRDIGEFLPLDVWGTRGWDTEIIRTTSHAGNTRDCDRFGKLYKVNIHADISRLTLAEVSKDLAVMEGRAKTEGMSKKEQVEGKRKVETTQPAQAEEEKEEEEEEAEKASAEEQSSDESDTSSSDNKKKKKKKKKKNKKANKHHAQQKKNKKAKDAKIQMNKNALEEQRQAEKVAKAAAYTIKKIADKAIVTSGKIVGKFSPLITLMESTVKESTTDDATPSHVLEAVNMALADLHKLYLEAQSTVTGKKKGSLSFSAQDAERKYLIAASALKLLQTIRQTD
jgi:hypothetical protein